MKNNNIYTIGAKIPGPSVTSTNSLTIKTASGRMVIIDDSLLDYLDLISTLLGVEDIDTFNSMSVTERKELIKKYKRNSKLEEVLK